MTNKPATTRKFKPDWPSAQADTPERRAATMAKVRKERNAIAKAHGYPNMGKIVQEFCGTSFERQARMLAILKEE